MAHLSIRLTEAMLEDLAALAKAEHQSTTELVREALEHYRQLKISTARKERLSKASLLVRSDSLRVNSEFAEFEGEPNET